MGPRQESYEAADWGVRRNPRVHTAFKHKMEIGGNQGGA